MAERFTTLSLALFEAELPMIFHKLFGRHETDLKTSHWDKGRFVSTCVICGCEMVKLPGLPWQASKSAR